MFRLPSRAVALVAILTGLAGPAPAQGLSGAYLAGQSSLMAADYEDAAAYFARALLLDPENPVLMNLALVSFVGVGGFDQALPIAQKLVSTGTSDQIGSMVLTVDAARKSDYALILSELESGQIRVVPLVDGLTRAWAEIGAGKMSEALATLDDVASKPTTKAFGLYHKALALAMAGDFEGAEKILGAGGEDQLNLTRRGILAHAEILSQLERNQDAVTLIDAGFGGDPDPTIRAVRFRLAAGEMLPFTTIRDAQDGLAEVYFSVGSALEGQAPDDLVLDFARTANALRSDHADATLLTAAMLDKIGRHDLAIVTYQQIGDDNPFYFAAEMGRSDALDAEGRHDEAIKVLEALAAAHPEIASVHVTLGDALRREARYEEAAVAYDKALAMTPQPTRNQWSTYFARGICNERLKHWDKAEPDFRMALKLQPDQPQVLNYLGYSLVELRQNLPEAMGMIEKAVGARPDDGYITDSLGWVYYRLGRYDEAVKVMERAVSLMPTDAVLNDHLGDVYWAVGRKLEAEFQWRRALLFEPEEPDLKRIQRKLEVGLDKVLEEEGAPPLASVHEG
jgi:tetratricopeptide (TPR) repeat protein